MAKLDMNIYGADDNATAEACAAAALANPHPSKYGGACIDNSAKSESSSDKSLKLDDASEQATVKSMRGIDPDSRAVSKGGHAATSTRAKTSKE